MKSIFASKTFWFNVLSAGLQYTSVMPQKWGMPVTLIGNIILRSITDSPVSIPILAPGK